MPRNIFIGAACGLVVAAALVALWVALYDANGIVPALIAVAAGVATGFAVAFGSKGGVLPGLVGVAIILFVSAVGQNFAQRSGLIDGIDKLQADWASFQVDPNAAPGAGKRTSKGEPIKYTSGCDDRPPGVLPPPAILEVLPMEGLLCMSPEELATVWEDVPEKRKAELPQEAVVAVERVFAETSQSALDESRKRFEEDSYEVPRPVTRCAPQPDFTQPTAAAALGFPDGVPLFLPAADLFADDRVRGDGIEAEPPTPFCFAKENAIANPLETVSWFAAAGLAFLIPFRRRSKASAA